MSVHCDSIVAKSALVWNRLPVMLLIGLGLGLAGCGSSSGKVSGSVTHQGQAVVGAEIAFGLEDQPAETFYGITGADGKYKLDVGAKPGLPPGRYQVVITDHVRADGSQLPGGEEGSVLRQSGQVAARSYTVVKEVVAGSNTLDIKFEEAQAAPTP